MYIDSLQPLIIALIIIFLSWSKQLVIIYIIDGEFVKSIIIFSLLIKGDSQV